MANHVVLNNVDHRDLRVITTHSAEYGDNVQFVPTFSWEFRSIQAHYPILFRKGADGEEMIAVALLGFENNENLFLGDSGWDANYIPLAVEQQPFLIGADASTSAATGGGPVIHVDMDSPRISSEKGLAVFEAHGGVSPYLDRINSVLKAVYDGYAAHKQFIEALAEHDLLETVAIDIELNDGSQNRLMGFLTINEDVLFELGADALGGLHEQGFLEPIYMSLASLSNIRNLIDRKNAQFDT